MSDYGGRRRKEGHELSNRHQRVRPDALVKVFGWYDNEWGYTQRLVDLTLRAAATR